MVVLYAITVRRKNRMKNKPYTIPAHEHIRLKEENITYNSDRGLKHRPFEQHKKQLKELAKGKQNG